MPFVGAESISVSQDFAQPVIGSRSIPCLAAATNASGLAGMGTTLYSSSSCSSKSKPCCPLSRSADLNFCGRNPTETAFRKPPLIIR